MPTREILEMTTKKKYGENPAAMFSRRDLLQGAAAWATISLVPRHVLGGPGQTAPSERIALAGVGVGGVHAKKAYDRWPQALRRKKPVCCVKPLTRTLIECRRVVETARGAGVATQVTASPNTCDSPTILRPTRISRSPIVPAGRWMRRPFQRPQGVL